MHAWVRVFACVHVVMRGRARAPLAIQHYNTHAHMYASMHMPTTAHIHIHCCVSVLVFVCVCVRVCVRVCFRVRLLALTEFNCELIFVQIPGKQR